MAACERAKREASCRGHREEDLRQDRAALTAFYHATGGPQWTASENWLSDAPLSAWHGVDVGSCLVDLPLGGVVSLNLEENNLAGQLPAALGSLTSLWVLNLSRNGLTGTIPPELANLGVLGELNLSHNDLTGEIPPGLGDLRILERIDLSHNRLSGQIPRDLSIGDEGPFPGGRHLFLNDNQLTGPLPESFNFLLDLDELRLGGANRFSGCIPNGLRTRGAVRDDLTTLGLFHCEDHEKAVLMSLYHATGGPNWTNSDNWPRNYPWPLPPGRYPDAGPPLDTWYGVETDHHTGRVTALRLEDNGLVGELPTGLSRLPELKFLYLAGNDLSGEVTPFLEELSDVLIIELEGNDRLTGCLPGLWPHLLTGLDLPPCDDEPRLSEDP